MMAFRQDLLFLSLFLNLFKMLYNLSYLLKLLSLYDYLFFLLSFILLLTIASFCSLDSLHLLKYQYSLRDEEIQRKKSLI